MLAQEKIALLESKIIKLENENLTLKSMLKQQTNFGNKMTKIVRLQNMTTSAQEKIALLESKIIRLENKNHAFNPYL